MGENNCPSELLGKYPDALRAPDPNCPKCKGRGEFNTKNESINDKPHACVCIFVEHEFCGIVRKALGQVGRSGLLSVKERPDAQ